MNQSQQAQITLPPRIQVTHIPESPGLDSITVYWEDFSPGRGQITITCFGSAWTSWFGGMTAQNTIKQFVAAVSVSYLVDKLGRTPHLYQRKKDLAYLTRVVSAVKGSLWEEEKAGTL